MQQSYTMSWAWWSACLLSEMYIVSVLYIISDIKHTVYKCELATNLKHTYIWLILI